MAFIDEQLLEFKRLIEDSIITGGAKGKESMIRSSVLINLIHDASDFCQNPANLRRHMFYP